MKILLRRHCCKVSEREGRSYRPTLRLGIGSTRAHDECGVLVEVWSGTLAQRLAKPLLAYRVRLACLLSIAGTDSEGLSYLITETGGRRGRRGRYGGARLGGGWPDILPAGMRPSSARHGTFRPNHRRRSCASTSTSSNRQIALLLYR